MIDGILGNKTAETIMLHIYHYGESHASGVVNDLGTSLTATRGQLSRFEQAGVLVSKQVGRTTLYSFNPKSPFTKPLKELVRVAYDSIPLKQRELMFKKRRRPRRKGKPIK
jgi:hypothetical protein